MQTRLRCPKHRKMCIRDRYHRYKAGKKGIIMLACELIDNNGKELLKCVNQYIDQ